MARMSLELGRTYPDIEIEVLISDRFDVETNCRYRSDDLSDLWAQGVSSRISLKCDRKPKFQSHDILP
mgnify:FL=1|jgi:hypothetical protein